MQKKKHSGEELYGELGKGFNFTKGDLEANRAGIISHRQKQARWKELGFIFAAYVLLLILFYGVMFGIGMAEDTSERASRAFWGITFLLGGMGVCIIIAIVPAFRETVSGRVEHLVRHVQATSKKGRVSVLIAGEQKFLLPFTSEKIGLKFGTAYHIYYLSKTMRLLSIEEVLSNEE